MLLEQSSTIADRVPWRFADGSVREIPSCYYEFALRHPDPDTGELYQGFVAASADRIFESTDTRHRRRMSMGLFSDYDGKGLNHVEMLYQTGERELAMSFCELLGCTVVPTDQANETGSTYICVYPDEADDDGINNVLYLSEIRPAQQQLEDALRRTLRGDAQLSSALEGYQTKARTLPFGIPHFGLRFPSFESIEPVLERLESCRDPALAKRFSVSVVRPSDPEALYGGVIQAFVFTDLIATGLFCLGQLIELQAQQATETTRGS